jgi:hypothetical protein
MARPRRPFRELSEGHQRRLLRFYEREHGWSRRQVAGRYDRGTLPDMSAARGHETTPEHGGGRRGGKTLPVLTQEEGRIDVPHLNRQERRLVGLHWSWLAHFLRTGDAVMWSPTRRREIDADFFERKTVGEERYHFETRLDEIEDAALTGETDIGDDLYGELEAE